MLQPRFSIKITGNPHLDKQTRFALASSLTLTAKKAQTEVIKEIEGAFTIRNNWVQPSNALGVRIKPATKQNLTTVIGTAADFLGKHMRTQQGIVVNLPQGRFLAVPTTNVRRTKRQIIRATQRPRALRGKRDFVLPMKSGKGFVLFQSAGRRGRRQAIALYILTPSAKIAQKDVLAGPVHRTFAQHFPRILEQQLKKAFATAR